MLRSKADRRSLTFILSYLVVVALALYFQPSVWILIALTPIFGIWCFSISTVVHNSQHCPVFKNRRANRAWHVVLSLGAGEAVSDYIPGHNLSHHPHLQEAMDPMRTNKVRHRSNLLNYLTFFWTASGAMSKLVYGYLWRCRVKHPAVFRQFVLEFVALLAFYLVVCWIDWRVFLFVVFIPHKFANWAIFSINYPQHDGCDTADPVNHSRNFVGVVDNWLFFNNGYHGIHHLKPGTHWSLYPALHRQLLSPTIHPNLEQPTLVGYLWRSAVWPGRRERYDGQPIELEEVVTDVAFDTAYDTEPRELRLYVQRE
jgi:fatty acid desaturase